MISRGDGGSCSYVRGCVLVSPSGVWYVSLHVRVGDDGLLDVLVDRGAALLVAALDLQGDLGPAGRFPLDLLLLENQRLVLLGVDLDFEEVGGRPRAGARDDLDRLAGRELAVHAGGRDADALLSAAHAQPMELGAVQELGEDRRNLLPDDPGTVVGDGDPEAGGLARGRRRAAVGATASTLTTTSGRIPASSHASSALSTASFTQVRSALRGLSNPRRCRFLVKNSETEISRWRAPISTADTAGRGGAPVVAGRGRTGLRRASSSSALHMPPYKQSPAGRLKFSDGAGGRRSSRMSAS